MAVDKKSQHVGNHGGAYTDENGMSKQFTYVDHDVKTKISTYSGETKPTEMGPTLYRHTVIGRILDISASLCPEEFYDFTIRGENKESIEWNESMLRNEGMEINKLIALCNILENRMEKTY